MGSLESRVATLQEKNKGKNPVLIRIDTRSGHGASSVTKTTEQLTDSWAFTFKNLGVTVKY
jgi:prolyl oligopeptidase